MVVACVVVLGGSELLSSRSLGGGVQVLDLSLTEDTVGKMCQSLDTAGCNGRFMVGCLHVGVAVGGLVHFGVVNHKEDLSCSRQPLSRPP